MTTQTQAPAIASLKPLVPFGRFVSLTDVNTGNNTAGITIDNSQRTFQAIASGTGAAQQNDYFNTVLLALLARKHREKQDQGPQVPKGPIMLNNPPSAATYGNIDQSDLLTMGGEPSLSPSPSPLPMSMMELPALTPQPQTGMPSRTMLLLAAAMMVSLVSSVFLLKGKVGLSGVLATIGLGTAVAAVAM